tara:strand:- start:288 stop:443 length:156 start_codon:yes stop_codon:yes gene_type:complete
MYLHCLEFFSRIIYFTIANKEANLEEWLQKRKAFSQRGCIPLCPEGGSEFL